MYQPQNLRFNHSAVALPANARETLFIRGEPCESIYEIRRGIVRAVDVSKEGDRQVMAFFFPGDFVGLPLTSAHRYSTEAVGPLLYARHSLRRWRHELSCTEQDENWANEAIWREEKAFMQRGLILGRVGALARVSAFLSYAGRHLPQREEVFEFPFPQADVASYLALSPETVCRMLRQLREARVISMPHKNRVIMQRPDRLAQMANGL